MTGTKLCEIGDPRWLEARLVVDQGDVELIAPGQKVEIMLAPVGRLRVREHRSKRWRKKDLKTSPVHLSSLHGGELPTKMDDDGVPRPIGLVFEVDRAAAGRRARPAADRPGGPGEDHDRAADARQPAVAVSFADVQF